MTTFIVEPPSDDVLHLGGGPSYPYELRKTIAFELKDPDTGLAQKCLLEAPESFEVVCKAIAASVEAKTAQKFGSRAFKLGNGL